MTDLKRLLRYLGPYRRDMVIGALLVVIETAFELFIPLLMADLIDVGVKNHDVPYILQQGVYMGICALLSLVTGLLSALVCPARAAYGWAPDPGGPVSEGTGLRIFQSGSFRVLIPGDPDDHRRNGAAKTLSTAAFGLWFGDR